MQSTIIPFYERDGLNFSELFRISRSFQSIPFYHFVQRNPVDIQNLGSPANIPVVFLQKLLDIFFSISRSDRGLENVAIDDCRKEKSSIPSVRVLERTTALSTAFSNSLTLPGQSYCFKSFRAAGVT